MYGLEPPDTHLQDDASECVLSRVTPALKVDAFCHDCSAETSINFMAQEAGHIVQMYFSHLLMKRIIRLLTEINTLRVNHYETEWNGTERRVVLELWPELAIHELSAK